MIILNTDKGLITVDSWDDIRSRPGFATNLDPAQHELKSIIARYAIEDKIHCGLSNCHTPHAKGYVVVTKDGLETNIGKDCGKTYFGVDFETLSRKFDRIVAEKSNRDALWNFSSQLGELKKRIVELRSGERGANWVYRQAHPLVFRNNGCPDEVVNRISSMIKARQNILSLSREATAEEIENLESIQDRRLQRPHYIDEKIAEIAGMEALYQENDLRDLLVFDLEERIKSFEQVDIDTLSYDELRDWAKWAGSVEKTIRRGNSIVSQGRVLLTSSNLQPFLKVLHTREETSTFRAFLKGLDPVWLADA